MSKKPLETLTDKELMELASSKYNIFETDIREWIE